MFTIVANLARRLWDDRLNDPLDLCPNLSWGAFKTVDHLLFLEPLAPASLLAAVGAAFLSGLMKHVEVSKR
jgi:hypothetical protein